MVGYSICIYSIARQDIERLRLENGVLSLEAQEESQTRFVTRLTAMSRRHKDRVRVALFGDNGCDQDCVEAARSQLPRERFVCEVLLGRDIREGLLRNVDVLVFPGGRASEQWESLGPEGGKAVCAFVHAGGASVGICAGAFLTTASKETCLGLLNARYVSGDRSVRRIGATKVHALGTGMVSLELTGHGRVIFGDWPISVAMLYSGGPIFLRGNRRDLPAFTNLAIFRSEVFLYDYQRGTMLGSPAIIAAPYGKGVAMAISPHPELTPGLERVLPKVVEMLGSDWSRDIREMNP